ncbi:hypothetical protein Htur_2081 [Haloterrigena turkmenica DSM 5511]|uniref:Uncharacterized protein n=1 Tax=Haloterrigena turkmenica (strain ATCC 51198 / DSM 5511 / JCM 9101 / NCIMB 13204 / VKM B-1734 / 4k) TaxID=543526 RepID=D2RT84_HALTV|nr:hypothetical protein [Haloterrigena turkmenica]ADB60964.1 hypothetical protein Htur_2081 [Haloterrigena turkmenica DSM 5511]
MTLREIPVVGELLESGAEDRVFDTLLLIGPGIILVIALLGRSPLTLGIAIGYLVFFLAYVLYRGVQH